MPSASLIAWVPAVMIPPAWASPVMAGLPLAWLFGVWAPAVPCGIPAIAAISRSNANAVAASAACLDWFLMLLSLFIVFRIRFVPLVFLILGR